MAAEMEVDPVEGAVAEEKSLSQLPEVVFMDWLLPLLDNNELLRLRRVNKGLMKVTDRYLRSHAPSKSSIILYLGISSGDSSLSQFLEEDRNSSIKMPSSVVELYNCGASTGWLRQLQSPEMDDFLLNYGNQIRSLTIELLTLPMERGSAQFQFFERIPKLQKLHIVDLKFLVTSEVPVDTIAAGDDLPNCLKTTLKVLNVDSYWTHDDDVIGKNRLWKLVVQLKNLETFRHPFNWYKVNTIFAYPWSSILENLSKIVNSKTTAIHTFDFYFTDDYFSDYSDEELPFMTEFISLCVSNKIKWTNIPAEFLLKMKQSQVAEFTDCVASMEYFERLYDFGVLVFSNVVKLSLDLYIFYENFPGTVLPLATIQERFSTARFPALRVLDLHFYHNGCQLDNKVLAALWKTFVNLEELLIDGGNIKLGNEAFFGNDIGMPPAFLQLTKLKKFSLRIPSKHALTDAVFSRVFRQMKLKEFYLTSSKPIKGISKHAILSLLTGPFFESIEKFPFHDWSLSKTSPAKFLKLARKFPNNQPL